MSEDSSTPGAIIARYGVVAYQLALAITDDTGQAERAVLDAADENAHEDDWMTYLARVRAHAASRATTAKRSQATRPSIDPGDVSRSPLPVETFAVRAAFDALNEMDRARLWTAFTSDARTVDESELGAALERFTAALRTESYPSAEDIP